MYLVYIVGFGIQAICQFFVGFILSIAISHNCYVYSFIYLLLLSHKMDANLR